MSEDVYTIPDLTKKVRYGRGEREQEMEERGEREERIVDIYVTADDLDLDPGTQQDALQKNTAQEQNEGSDQSKNNHSRAAAVCLVLLSLLLAVIIGLVIKYSEKITEKNNLVKDLEQLQLRYNNVTEERDDLKRRLCESYGFTFDGGAYYYVSTERKTWAESRQYCRDRQSDLMVINSEEKQDIVERVAGTYQNRWLGLTNREEEGVWKWVDGTPLTTPTYWRSGEPNRDGKEVCIVFYNGYDKGWYDITCNENNHWICERVLC